jgi:hypothetical protein
MTKADDTNRWLPIGFDIIDLSLTVCGLQLSKGEPEVVLAAGWRHSQNLT